MNQPFSLSFHLGAELMESNIVEDSLNSRHLRSFSNKIRRLDASATLQIHASQGLEDPNE